MSDSPIGTPAHENHTPKRWTVESYVPPKFSGKISRFDESIPNSKLKIAANGSFSFGKNSIEERPPVAFVTLQLYRDNTPEIDSIIEYMTNLIVGTDFNINTADDIPDGEEVKEILEEFTGRIDLHSKIRNLVDDSLQNGTSIFARVFNGGELANVEQFDMTMIRHVDRDEYGNPLALVLNEGFSEDDKITNLSQLVPLVFRPRGRDYFGRSIFHGLAVPRHLGNRTVRPLVEAFWSRDDVAIGTLENYSFPVEYHIFDNISEPDLEKEAQKSKDIKPGDKVFVSRKEEIQRIEPSRAQMDPFIQLFKDLVQLGTGFPLEILLGDFTSRAASQTTDSLLMRRVKAFQQHLVKIITKEILHVYLKKYKGSRWTDEKKLAELAITVEFETQTPHEYTPDQVLARVNAGLWTKQEGRQWDKANGQDLFDDKEIKASDEKTEPDDKSGNSSQKKKESKRKKK